MKKIKEITKDALFFNGKELIKEDHTVFRDLRYIRLDAHFILDFMDKDDIEIFWHDIDGDYYHVYVNDLFFDDFESYLEYVKDLVIKNNKTQNEKYTDNEKKLKEKFEK